MLLIQLLLVLVVVLKVNPVATHRLQALLLLLQAGEVEPQTTARLGWVVLAGQTVIALPVLAMLGTAVEVAGLEAGRGPLLLEEEAQVDTVQMVALAV